MHDNILNKIIKIFSKQLAKHCQYNIQTEIFHKISKHTTVIPLLKNGSKRNLSNYRIISLTNIINKLTEKCTKEKLTQSFHKHDIINKLQFDFWDKKSNFDVISNVTGFVYNMFDKGKIYWNILGPKAFNNM